MVQAMVPAATEVKPAAGQLLRHESSSGMQVSYVGAAPALGGVTEAARERSRRGNLLASWHRS